MEKIGNIIQQQPTTQPSSSTNSQQVVEAFLADFPTLESVCAFFVPTNWPTAIKYADLLITRPCIKLAEVDEVYNADGAALQIVQSQFVGLHKLSGSRNEYSPKSAEFAANMFLSKYGNVCTLFDTMIYFANYFDYKTTFAQFDPQDIMQQFGNKYFVWKRNRKCQLQEEEEQPQEQEQQNEVVGQPALEQLIFERMAAGQTDEQLRQSALYEHGFFKEKMIKNARKKLTSHAAF